jgi:hypothetical protein
MLAKCRQRVFAKPTPLPGIWDYCSPSETGMGQPNRHRGANAHDKTGHAAIRTVKTMGSSPYCRLGLAASSWV